MELTSQAGSADEMFLSVRIGKSLHAIPIQSVEEVLPALPIEPIPNCPPFVQGVLFVRGHLIPVLSGAERLGIANHQPVDDPHIVCLNANGRLVGVEFDEALDLLELRGEQLRAESLGARGGFMTGVIDRHGEIIRVLNAEKLIDASEQRVMEQIAAT